MGPFAAKKLNSVLRNRTSVLLENPGGAFRLLHWELSNPLIIASSPLTSSGRAIRQILETGPGAVITKTITPCADLSIGGSRWIGDHLFNADGYSRHPLENWEHELEDLRGEKVIANIFASTPNELAELARRIAATGVEILELGLSCATKGDDPVCFRVEELAAYVKTVRRAVPNVGILVKVQWEPSEQRNRALARTIADLGGDGISCCDTFPALLNPEQECGGVQSKVVLGGLSGPALGPLVRRAIHTMSDERPGLPIVAIGGIERGVDVLNYLKSGACAVQACTSIMRNGRSWVPELVSNTMDVLGRHLEMEL